MLREYDDWGEKLALVGVQSPPAARGPADLVVAATRLNVRERPAADSKAITQVVAGTVVKEVERKSTWVLVEWRSGDRGWVASKYLRPRFGSMTSGDLYSEFRDDLWHRAGGFLRDLLIVFAFLAIGVPTMVMALGGNLPLSFAANAIGVILGNFAADWLSRTWGITSPWALSSVGFLALVSLVVNRVLRTE
jgi:hypothetical protein